MLLPLLLILFLCDSHFIVVTAHDYDGAGIRTEFKSKEVEVRVREIDYEVEDEGIQMRELLAPLYRDPHDKTDGKCATLEEVLSQEPPSLGVFSADELIAVLLA
jgi:hypothetical protein